MEFVNNTTLYEHKEKGGIYRILYVHKMKHPDNGEWLPCVTYKSMIDDRVWTRSLASFLLNFDDYNEIKYKKQKETSSATSPVGK